MASGTLNEAVPVTGLASNFSPMPLMAPPPTGRLTLPTRLSPLPALLSGAAELTSVPLGKDAPSVCEFSALSLFLLTIAVYSFAKILFFSKSGKGMVLYTCIFLITIQFNTTVKHIFALCIT
jgi:hypothetical protein